MSSVDRKFPEGWVETTLEKVCEITSSKRIFAKEYQTSGIPFFRGKEVTEKFNGYKVSTELFITKKKYDEIKSKYGVPCENDILLTSVGTLGNPYLVEKDFEFYFKDGNITWFKNFNNVDSKFLYHWIISPQGKENLSNAQIGSTQQAYTMTALKRVDIVLPKIEEQKAIAQVLTAFDDKIENLRAQNQTLETLAQTIFKEWFLPSRQAGGKYQVGDELPEGWRVGKLGEEFDISIGRTPPRKESQWFSDTPTGKKWISIKDIGNCGVYIENTSEYLTDEAIEKFNIPIIPKNTTILSFKMTVGKLTITTEDMLSNEAIAHLKLKDGTHLTSEYIYLYLYNLDFNSLGSTSSIVTAINSTIIKNLDFVVPDVDILKKFGKVVNSIFKKIKNNTNQIQSLAKTRDTLLPKLMSGQLRVDGLKSNL